MEHAHALTANGSPLPTPRSNEAPTGPTQAAEAEALASRRPPPLATKTKTKTSTCPHLPRPT
eukprot:scaffold45006_cov29-Tisochrysis_lutea.AAC.2